MFKLIVGDNFARADQEGGPIRSYSSYEEAVAAAAAIVDESLRNLHQPGMTSRELYEAYTHFGDDPAIVPAGEPRFSAWEHARTRTEEICRGEDAVAATDRYDSWPPELDGFRPVIAAVLRRHDLGSVQRKTCEGFLQAIDDYPSAMPPENHRYWLRIEAGGAAFTVFLRSNRFEFRSDKGQEVDWTIYLRGSGSRDRRAGNATAGFEAMRKAALERGSIIEANG